MKTKFIKVPVSERLPDKSGRYHTSMGRIWFFNETKRWQFTGVEYWLEEVPDYEDEMVVMLNSCALTLQQLGMREPLGITNLLTKIGVGGE